MDAATENPHSQKTTLQEAYLWSREKPLSAKELAAFGKMKKPRPNPMPYVAIIDQNNVNEQDSNDGNRPHSAIVVGIKGTF